MTSLLKSLIGPPMCENCGVQPKFATFDYCGKTCAAEAEKKKRTRASRTTQPITGSTSIASNSSSAQAMCQNCHLKPVVPGHRYCSKTCGDSAKKAGATPLDDQSISGMRAPQPVAGSTSTTSNTSTDQKMCRNCRSKPIFPGHDYCGKTCADWVKSQENSVAQTASASGPPNSAAGPKSRSYNSSDNVETPVSNPPATSNLCEHCFTYVKSREMEEDGTIVTHSHCGIGCYKAAQHTVFASSTIPAPAAASVSQNSLRLRAERMNTPVGRKVLLMVQERWQSEIVRIPQVKGIYRIDLPGNIYQRFDLALQMNEDCTIKTTYYGGIATCSITDDTDPAPCAFESCDLCDALHSSFGNLLQGGSCRDGSYGPGLYTYSNPALAHDMMVSGYARQAQKVNYALVQCRVVIQADYMPSSNSYAGFIDDSGVAFCAQSTAIIPTHLLIYSLDAPPDTQQPAGSVNTDVASVGPAVSAATPASGGLGQPKSSTNTGYGEMKLKSAKGKGKARANGPLQEPQRQRSDMGSSSIYYSSQQVAPGGTGAAASQTVPTPLPPSLTPTGQRRGGSINTGTGPAVGLPPPLSSQRGLPNTSAPPPGAAKPAAGGDPPTANDHAAPSSALKAHQPGGSSAPHVVPAPKLAPGGDPFWDDEESSPARGHMPEAIYQTNLASPGPGWVSGFIPVQSPAPAGLKTRELQGKSYAGRPGQQPAYDEDLRSGAAATRKLMTPSEDLNSRMDVDENFDYLNLDESLGRRPNQHNDDEDDDPYADLPEHPPARLLDHPPNHPANRRRPPRK